MRNPTLRQILQTAGLDLFDPTVHRAFAVAVDEQIKIDLLTIRACGDPQSDPTATELLAFRNTENCKFG